MVPKIDTPAYEAADPEGDEDPDPVPQVPWRMHCRIFSQGSDCSCWQESLYAAPDTDAAPPEKPAHNTDAVAAHDEIVPRTVRSGRRTRTCPATVSAEPSVKGDDGPGFYELLHRLSAAHELALANARHKPKPSIPSLRIQAVTPLPSHQLHREEGSRTQSKSRPCSRACSKEHFEPPPVGSRTQSHSRACSKELFEPPPATPSHSVGRAENLSVRSSGSQLDTEDFKLIEVWSQDPAESLHRYSFSFTPKAIFSGSQENVVTGSSVLQPIIIHPNSMGRLVWDLLSMMVLAYDIIMIPYVSAFDPPVMEFSTRMNDATMVFWSLDMLASLVTGYQDGRDIVLYPKAIIMRYLKTWFWLDCFIVGLDWTLFFLREAESTGSSAASLARSLKTLRFTRSLRLIRLLKVKRILQGIQDQINTEALSICFRVIKIIFVLLLANHTVACAWYGIGVARANSVDDGLSSWVAETEMDKRTLTYRYVTSLHWSLTQFTPASMEVSPQNENERIFAVVVLLLAMITFSSFVSILTASMAELRNISSDEEKQFWLLRRYLRDWEVSKRFAVRLQRYLEFAYTKQRQRVQAKDVKLLSLLSGPLRDELKAETFSVHLLIHPLFYASSSCLRVFSRALSDMYLGQGDCAFSCGEQGSSMLFLCTGIFSYQLGELVTVKPTMSDNCSVVTGRPQQVCEGQWVAEAVLWTHWLHLGDLVALTDGQAISIDAQAFGRSVMVYRPSWMDFRTYALRFVQAMNRIDPNELTDLLHLNLNSQEIVDATSLVRQQTQFISAENNEVALMRLGRVLWNQLGAVRSRFSGRFRSETGEDFGPAEPATESTTSQGRKTGGEFAPAEPQDNI